jgi:hypothetical protein
MVTAVTDNRASIEITMMSSTNENARLFIKYLVKNIRFRLMRIGAKSR